jgi:hypothetical protein
MSSTQRSIEPDTTRVDDELLTMQEAADVVRVPVATLRYWRHLGTGPRSFRIGRSVRYWRRDVPRSAIGLTTGWRLRPTSPPQPATATRGSSQGTYGRAGDACGWVTSHMRRCSAGLPDSNWHRPA